MMGRRPPGGAPVLRFSTKREGPPILSVGRNVRLVGKRSSESKVALSDENGVPTGDALATGIEVEILAWRPRGPNGPRYRVRCPASKIEGWLDLTNLEALPTPPPPVRPVAPPAPARAAAVKKKAATVRKKTTR